MGAVDTLKGKGTLVLLPALNEEKAIGLTLEDIRTHYPLALIVVVDNGSTDKTAEIATHEGAAVIYETRRGKGVAIRSGITTILSPEFWPALDIGFQYVVMMDSDYTYPAKHIPEIVDELEQGADVVIGYRTTRQAGAMTRMNVWGNKGLNLLSGALYGIRIRDVCSGMWGFRREALSRFRLTSDGFTLEADLLVNAWKDNHRLTQIPIEYRSRLNGSKTHLKVRDGLKIGWFLIKARLR
jgi:dolichol-phosphate hexosyltransferase